MSFQGRTPESLMPRSDSRNPATTCKGITKSGRPCRRPIDAKPSQDDGVIAVASVADDSDGEDVGAAAYFCWQHKDQAEALAAQDQATTLYPLKKTSSIDTLAQRLGVLGIGEEETRKKKSRHGGINRPPTWNKVEGPLIHIPSDMMAEKKRKDSRNRPMPSKREHRGFLARMCCGSIKEDDEPMELPRPTHKHHASTDPHQPPRRRTSSALPTRPAQPAAKPTPQPQRTGPLRYIPASLSPELTSTLLAELQKPISPHDEEGYIYIFWLTPDTLGPAPSSTASTLLTPPSRADGSRQTSDVLRQYSVKSPHSRDQHASRGLSDGSSSSKPDSKDTILLKIGRANNVHRRMNEWTQQCGYSLSLVRFYPYVSSTPSPAPSASAGVRKVPYAHKVERLVHLELGAQRVVKKCDACGKEHREWFKVEATKEGVKRVDEVVRRWVDWCENEAKK